MREQFHILGKNLSRWDKANVSHSIARNRGNANIFDARYELPKTQEEIRMIETAESLLRKEFLELGIADVPTISPERYHFMTRKWFDAFEKGIRRENYKMSQDKAVFDREQFPTAAQFFKVILHESVHAVQCQKYWADTENGKHYNYRIGYKNTGQPEGGGATHYEAFNEGVVESTALHLIFKYEDVIRDRLSFGDDEIGSLEFSYPEFREVVEQICYGIGSWKGEDPLVVWERVEAGQFTGEMMHLRDVEGAYGKGALRILDALKIITENDEDAEVRRIIERNGKIIEYFSNYDRSEEDRRDALRDRLAREILGDESYRKHCFPGKDEQTHGYSL